MKFDRFEDDGLGATALPDGQHVATITKAKHWTSQDGSRSALVVTFKVEGYDAFSKFLDPEVQRDHGMAMKLGAALGLRAADGLPPDEITGRELVVITKQATKDGMPVFDELGGRRIWVNGFLPSNGAAAAPPVVERAVAPESGQRAPAKRTPKQKADAAATGGTDDDIPFLWLIGFVGLVASSVMA
jgi:hypothetical protein